MKCSVTVSSETWMVHFPSGLAIRSQWTLYFIQSFVQIRGLVWHSQRGSLKVCVTRSRWTIWHLEEMPARRKVGTSWVFRARACLCVVEFWGVSCLHSSVDVWWSSAHFPTTFLTSLAYYSVGSLCQSEKPIWNAVIWLDRNRTADRVQRLRCVRGTQTDCRIDSLCEAPVAPMFTLSDGPFWQPSHKQTSHSRKKEMPHHKTT